MRDISIAWALAFALAWLVIVSLVLIFVVGAHSRRLDDLDKRITTRETIRIEYHAPPEGVSP